MAATGGVSAPVPPKRPTVIRPGISTGPAVPSRPAPPVPVRKVEDDSTVKNVEPRPNQPPPPPARPTDRTRPTSVISPTQDKPSNSSTGSTSGKRRPEITIVSARPMSEIGFRNVPSDVHHKPANTKVTSDQPKEDTQPSMPNIRPPPRPQSTISPTATQSPVSPTASQSTVSPTAARVPPPRPTVIKPNVPAVLSKPDLDKDNRGVEQKQPVRAPPPIPRHPPSPKQRTLSDNDPSGKPAVVPNGLPVPVPRPGSAIKHEQHDDTNNNGSGDNLIDVSVPDNINNSTEGMYSVINKPKRPTIIRPNRQTVKQQDEQISQSEVSESIPKEPPAVPIKVIPSPPIRHKDNQENTASNILSARKSFFESQQEEQSVPEFLTKKLKPTITSEGEVNDTNDKETLKKPPPPPAKPKPTIVPKPTIAAKPSIALKPVINKNENTKENEDKSNDIPFSEQNMTLLEKTLPESEVVKPSVKRPTIIRPSRVVQSTSSEFIGSPEQSDTKTTNDRLRSSDDNLNRLQSRPQPPLPNKRPVSMINIPDALAQEEKKVDLVSKSHSFISSSTENINKSQTSPTPMPRPMARPRPASMMVTSNPRPPLPLSGPKGQVKDAESASPPLKPQHRPTVHPVRDKASKMSAIGVPVLPRVEKREPNDVEPTKPVQRPPPPKVTPPKVTPLEVTAHAESTSSEDEEFFAAQTKPDRPTGPPKPRARTLSEEGHKDGSADKKPPPRPAGGPTPPTPPRKMSGSMEIDDSSPKAGSKSKPERPNTKPPRPGSVPVQMEQPARPQPPKPGGPPSRRKPSGEGLPPRPGPNHPLYSYMMQAAHGIALYDYTARHDDELEFKKDDVIVLVKVIDSEWILGKVRGREGMFPAGFIKVKMPLPGQDFVEDSSDEGEEIFYDASTDTPDDIGSGPRCRARFDFEGEGDADLPFEAGDMIKLLERVGTEWRKGECKGRVGVFPLVFVEVIEDLQADTSALSKDTVVKALFDFDGEANELSFQAGDRIDVKYAINEEWLFGEIGERSGQFPVQFIDHVPSELPPMSGTENQSQSRQTDPITASLAMWDTVDVEPSQPMSPPEEKKADSGHGETPNPVQKEKPYCVAIFDYPGETTEDLKFSTGDRIDLLEKVNSDWLKGSCHGRTGMFPTGFVDIKIDLQGALDNKPGPLNPIFYNLLEVAIENIVEEKRITDEQFLIFPQCFQPSQRIEFDSTESQGLTPETSTSSLTDLQTSDITPTEVHTEIGVAQYDFTGEAENELTFKTGDKIELHEHVSGAEDWRFGVLNGQWGIFPAAFVMPGS